MTGSYFETSFIKIEKSVPNLLLHDFAVSRFNVKSNIRSGHQTIGKWKKLKMKDKNKTAFKFSLLSSKCKNQIKTLRSVCWNFTQK